MSANGSLLSAPWALWLLAPLVFPVLVALVMWWRGRPARPATVPESIAGHRAYLSALDSALDKALGADSAEPKVAQAGIKGGG